MSNRATITEFPEASRMSSNAELECQMFTKTIFFKGEITNFHFEERCEGQPDLSVHSIELGEGKNFIVHCREEQVEFWHAEGVDIEYRDGRLTVTPREA